MELQDYLAVVRKRWLSIAVVTALVTAAAIAFTAVATPAYTARSQVYVSVRGGGTTAELLQGSNYTQRQVKSYTDIVTTPRVLQPVIEELGLTTEADELGARVSADSPLDTSLINIRVTDADPQAASDIANALAEHLAEEVAELERPEEGSAFVEISTVRPATPPEAPSSPNATRNVALGLLLGLALGFGLAVLREVLDTRVRTPDDVRALTDASVMTVLSLDEDLATHRMVVRDRPQGPHAEAFRRLRTNLQFLDAARRLETIVVTSSVPGEGKSTVAANLALTLSEAGAKVVLVDADLRRPSVAEYLGLEGGVGLTTVLIGQATVDEVVQPWGTTGLAVLAAGQVPPNPSEMVGSRAMAWVLGELAKRHDVVVVDTPPLLPVTDAAILARITGGALVVAGANRLHRDELTESLDSLERVGARVLGIVVNKVQRGSSEPYAYYGGDRSRERSRRRRLGRLGAGTAAAGLRRSARGRRARPGWAAPDSPPVAAPPGTTGAPATGEALPAQVDAQTHHVGSPAPRRVPTADRQPARYVGRPEQPARLAPSGSEAEPARAHLARVDLPAFDELLADIDDRPPRRRPWGGASSQ